MSWSFAIGRSFLARTHTYTHLDYCAPSSTWMRSALIDVELMAQKSFNVFEFIHRRTLGQIWLITTLAIVIRRAPATPSHPRQRMVTQQNIQLWPNSPSTSTLRWKEMFPKFRWHFFSPVGSARTISGIGLESFFKIVCIWIWHVELRDDFSFFFFSHLKHKQMSDDAYSWCHLQST